MNRGFTKVYNILFDTLLKSDITYTEFKVMFAIIRYTYGYHREEWTLSASYISTVTGKSHRSVKYAIKSLCEKNMISKSMEYGTNSFSVNDVTLWEGYEELHTPYATHCTGEVKQNAPKVGQHIAHNKDNININNKYNYKERKSNFTVPTPKPTAFNNFAPSGHIDYKKIEMDALKKQMERLKNDTATS